MVLDKKIVEELKVKLLEEKKRLEKELGRFTKLTDVPGEYKTTFVDIGTDKDENASEVEEYTDNLALEDNLEKQLKDVNNALKKIDKGTYGKCENCEGYIREDRLKIYPAAKVCMKCAKE